MTRQSPPTDRGLSRYVPKIAVEWDTLAPGRQWQEIDGTLCFADISGFTKLSERLARRGRIGAEELTDVLNGVFSAMLRNAYEYGGSLIKFGGDALLLLFSGSDHAIRAASAMVAMQRTLRATTSGPSTAGRISLRMSVGAHSGRIQLFCVGTSHREIMITGPAGTLTTTMEHTADAGEIVVSSATRDLLPPGAASVPKGEGWLLKWRKPAVLPQADATPPGEVGDRVNLWMPAALRSFLAAARPEPEHRVVTVGFIRFCGVDDVIAREGPESVAAHLQQMVDVIQQAADAEDVTFLATDINEDGGKVILVAGAPTVQEDDEGRLMRAARRVADATTRFDLHIGVNRGHVFAGEVGTDYRSTYTVMGDTVNVAARLCAAAWASTIYATPDVLERSHTLYASEQLEPLWVKGKTEPLVAYRVGEELGFRSASISTELPFVGRPDELAAVIAALDAALARTPALVSIVGETGSGKSRLIEEALNARPGLRVFEVRAEPYGAANPYRPFRDPLRDLLGIERDTQSAMATALTAAIAATDASLLPFAPLLADAMHIELAETSATEAIEPRFRRDRLADVMVALLRQLLDEATVFVVEDGHWMDEASGDLLSRIAAASSPEPWAMLATRRPVDDGFTLADAELVELRPLTADSAAELVIAATAAAPLRTHEVENIVNRAGGNPLFIEETIRVVREAGGADALPDSLAAVVGTRIDALPPLARRILRYSSVLGRSFRTDALRELLDADGIALDPATRRQLTGFIERDGRSRLRFRHAMTRDVAYDGLSFRRRRELHLRAGSAAERQAAGHAEDIADLLATHYSLAADHDRAWKFSRIAGDRAKEAYANVEAATNYERALESARRLDDVSDVDRAEVWIDLGDVRGPIGLLDAALDAYRRASRLLGHDTIACADVHYKRALMRERVGAYSQALREITTGQKLLGGLGSTDAAKARARLSVRRAFVRQAQEKPAQALEIAEHAVGEAQAAGEAHAEGLACMVVHWAHLVLGLPDGAQYGERALRIFRDLDDLESLAGVTNLLGADAYYAGKWDDAIAYYAQGQEAAMRAGNVVFAASIGSNTGEVLVFLGRLDEAEPVLREAARVEQASGYAEGAAEMRLGRLLMLRGALDEAEEILERNYRRFTELKLTFTAVEAQMDLAFCRLRMGRPAEAEAMLAAIEHQAGDDFVMLAPTLARYRAAALDALDRQDEALAVAYGGLERAEAQGFDYEEALLMLTIDQIESRAPGASDGSRRDTALAMLQNLGVRDPSMLHSSSSR